MLASKSFAGYAALPNWLYCARTQAHAVRRTKIGKSKRAIICCLKRYIARKTYHALIADLTDLAGQQVPRSRHATAITCGAGLI